MSIVLIIIKPAYYTDSTRIIGYKDKSGYFQSCRVEQTVNGYISFHIWEVI